MTDPQSFLPDTPEQWHRRVRRLIAELRRPDLHNSTGHLYFQDHAGQLLACFEGPINELAIQDGLPASWVDMEIEAADGTDATIWEVISDEADPDHGETVNRALPAARACAKSFSYAHGEPVEPSVVCNEHPSTSSG